MNLITGRNAFIGFTTSAARALPPPFDSSSTRRRSSRRPGRHRCRWNGRRVSLACVAPLAAEGVGEGLGLIPLADAALWPFDPPCSIVYGNRFAPSVAASVATVPDLLEPRCQCRWYRGRCCRAVGGLPVCQAVSRNATSATLGPLAGSQRSCCRMMEEKSLKVGA